jgi:hypothetical protein
MSRGRRFSHMPGLLSGPFPQIKNPMRHERSGAG